VLTNGKPGTIPASVAESLSTAVAGKTLESRHLSMYPWNRTWDFTAETLGRDVAVILSARRAAPAAPVDASQIDQLIQQLKGRDMVQRAQAAARIASLGPAGAKATAALVEALDDDRELRVVGPGSRTTVGDQAAKALVRIGATSALADFFQSEANDTARNAALLALAVSRHPGLADLMMAALDDRARQVRTRAAYLASRTVGKPAIPRLIEIVGRTRYVETREGARASLVELTGQDFGLDGDKWRAWWAANGGGKQ
jgi:hypothetical protein